MSTVSLFNPTGGTNTISHKKKYENQTRFHPKLLGMKTLHTLGRIIFSKKNNHGNYNNQDRDNSVKI